LQAAQLVDSEAEVMGLHVPEECVGEARQVAKLGGAGQPIGQSHHRQPGPQLPDALPELSRLGFPAEDAQVGEADRHAPDSVSLGPAEGPRVEDAEHHVAPVDRAAVELADP
jgi:hypothetical protein